MSKKFHKFVAKWKETNVTDAMSNQCNEWFMGRHEDLIPNITVKLQNNDINKTPYTKYNRYRVERIDRPLQ